MNHTWTLGNSVIQSRQDYWTVSVLHTIARPIINSLPFFCKVRKTLAFERNLHFGLVYSAIIACVHLRKGQTQFVPYLQIVHSGLKPPNLLQWPFLGLKMKWNQCRGLGIGSKLLLLTFWNFGLWPCDLLAFGLCDLAENLHAQMEVWKEAACKFSSKSVKKWLIYSIFYVTALTFY